MAYCQPLPASGISGCGATELGQTASLCITNGTVGYSMGAYDDIENPFVLSELLFKPSSVCGIQ